MSWPEYSGAILTHPKEISEKVLGSGFTRVAAKLSSSGDLEVYKMSCTGPYGPSLGTLYKREETDG
jgi:hypothetical protein